MLVIMVKHGSSWSSWSSWSKIGHVNSGRWNCEVGELFKPQEPPIQVFGAGEDTILLLITTGWSSNSIEMSSNSDTCHELFNNFADLLPWQRLKVTWNTLIQKMLVLWGMQWCLHGNIYQNNPRMEIKAQKWLCPTPLWRQLANIISTGQCYFSEGPWKLTCQTNPNCDKPCDQPRPNTWKNIYIYK